MKSEKLLLLVGNIADDLIEETAAARVCQHRKPKKAVILSIAAALILLLTATAFAVGYGWHRELTAYLQPSEEQMEALDSAVNTPEMSVTENGVTITIKQTLSDAFGVYILYEMTVPDSMELDKNVLWETCILEVPTAETEDAVAASTYEAAVMSQEGNKQTVLLHCQSIAPFESGTIRLILQNLCDFDMDAENGPYVPLAGGTWKLAWDYTYEDPGTTVEVGCPVSINGSSNTAVSVYLSPMSVCLFITGDDITTYAQPVVQFKDQHTLTFDSQSKNASFLYCLREEETEVYTNQLYYRFETVMDLESIESVQIGDISIPMK